MPFKQLLVSRSTRSALELSGLRALGSKPTFHNFGINLHTEKGLVPILKCMYSLKLLVLH